MVFLSFRIKAVEKHIPYEQADAELYAGLGTDNGPKKSAIVVADQSAMDMLQDL